MSYALSESDANKNEGLPFRAALERILAFMAPERRAIAIAFGATPVASAAALAAPFIIGRTVDTYIARGVLAGIGKWAAVLVALYLVGFVAGYVQRWAIGAAGRRILFNLRNELFAKLQEMPVAFFYQNRSGDLISRINDDTDRLHQFIVLGLIQIVTGVFLMAGTGIVLVSLHPWLGLAALAPAAGTFVVTYLVSGRVKQRSFESMQALGHLSGEVQESLANFKVVVAFDRADYFRQRFRAANEANFRASVRAGIAGAILGPLNGLAYHLGVLVVLVFGLSLIAAGSMTKGLLVGYLLYVNSFYQSLAQVGVSWPLFQVALASLDRFSKLLALKSDLVVVPASQTSSSAVMEFRGVSFGYTQGREVLHRVDFALERGKTYALVGPTGGGKTTTAFLMARFYDPLAGQVLLGGRDIRSYSAADRARRVGFILQEPFLFSGTVGDNIVYGNPECRDYSRAALGAALDELGLSMLVARFESGLDTEVTSDGDSISFGQKQLIAFVRTALRRPELLILDEATANVDTVTEQLLETALARQSSRMTRVVIAHRLSTIKKADEIFFVNAGHLIRAGSMEHALNMLSQGKTAS
ncbi:MAG TPA: ABC transporter ATP-binding protein [Gammaproteobacteria bacterium]|nr:ABC transporter ATP-binding protein [Gammaproteobacteria bacterium]